MEKDDQIEPKVTKKFNFSSSNTKLLLSVLVVSLILGVTTGYFLSAPQAKQPNRQISINGGGGGPPKTAEQDFKTFRDFAEGKVAKKEPPKNSEAYSEGTHLLIREGAVSVALTSSVVDLSKYEGKKVKVYGETQKAIKEGWLMDVGKVEEK